MNHLLRTLTQGSVKPALPEQDLRLLLTTVRDTRRHNTEKLADPFYESLEALLNDLRTVTADNHDAEAFLKPVGRQEAPDYADIIETPMDLGTMLRKVKNKSYKSKREFKDDLDLIWSNCYKYNATEGHPLRLCASRLKAKAERLLENITDRKERTDPYIPLSLAGATRPPGVAQVKKSTQANGILVNGINGSHRSSSRSSGKLEGRSASPARGSRTSGLFNMTSFGDSLAIIRTGQGMSEFSSLDSALDRVPDDGIIPHELSETLRALLQDDDELGSPMDEDVPPLENGHFAGDKRKLTGVNRPRKRLRLDGSRNHDLERESLDLWWDVVQAEPMLANGLPALTHAFSSSRRKVPLMNVQAPLSAPVQRPKRPKKRPQPSETPQGTSLLTLMSTNIRTMKRVRRAHRKLELLTATDETVGGAGGLPPEIQAEPAAAVVGEDEGVDDRPWRRKGGKSRGRADAQEAEGCLRWMSGKVLEHAGFQGTSAIALDVLSGVASEFLLNVGRTIRFLSDEHGKQMTPEEIILHTLFESGITQVQDLERYIQDDIVRYGSRMSDLEKKLVSAYNEATVAAAGEAVDDDALFEEKEEGEDGAFVMGGFADAFGEDFLGLKELGIADEFGLTNLSVPKRLLRAKKAAALSSEPAKSKEPPLPYPPPPPLLPLTAEAAEHQIGLLRGYFSDRFRAAAAAVVPAAPPPPLPTVTHSLAPPTLAPPSLTPPSLPGPGSASPAQSQASSTFFTFSTLPSSAPSSLPSAPTSLPGTTGMATPPVPPENPSELTIPPDLVLPDELPDAAHCKLGPLGQVLKSSGGGGGGSGSGGGGAGGGATSGGSKKKAKVTVPKEIAASTIVSATDAATPPPSATSNANVSTPNAAPVKGANTKASSSQVPRPVGRPPLPDTQKKKKPSATKTKKKSEGGPGNSSTGSGGGIDSSVPPPLVAASA